MKKKTIIIVIVALLLLGLIIFLSPGLYMLNWQKYDSPENGYSVKYPKRWKVSASEHFLSFSTYDGDQGAFPPEGDLWLDIWVQELKTQPFDKLVEEVATTLKTEKESVVIKNADEAYKVSTYLYVKRGNKFYSIVENGNKPTLRNRIDAVLAIGSFELK
jgi:hypothetical protein